jgi:type II secretory pathway component PulK
LFREARRREKGVALLIVIIVLVVLSLMFGAVITGTRNFTRETTARLVALKMQAAMDGALYATVSDLSQGGGQANPYTPRSIRIGSISVTVALRPELAKIDLNYANPAVIERLLRESGVDKELSQRLAKEIAAWRSSPGGSGSPERPYPVSSSSQFRPFESILELGLLRSGSGDLISCLTPDVTLFSHSSDVDFAFASDRVRRAVSGDRPQEASRSSNVVAGDAAGVADLLEVSQTARDEASGLTMSRRTVLRLSSDLRIPFYLLSDISPAPSAEEALAACSRLAGKAG